MRWSCNVHWSCCHAEQLQSHTESSNSVIKLACVYIAMVGDHFEQQVLQVYMSQECTNSRHQGALVTRFYVMAPNGSVSSVWNLLHVTILMSKIVRWLLDFWKMCTPLMYVMSQLALYMPTELRNG